MQCFDGDGKVELLRETGKAIWVYYLQQSENGFNPKNKEEAATNPE